MHHIHTMCCAVLCTNKLPMRSILQRTPPHLLVVGVYLLLLSFAIACQVGLL